MVELVQETLVAADSCFPGLKVRAEFEPVEPTKWSCLRLHTEYPVPSDVRFLQWVEFANNYRAYRVDEQVLQYKHEQPSRRSTRHRRPPHQR